MAIIEISTTEMIYRVGGAGLIGGCLGFNRELHRKAAGPRTLALVGVGSAVLTLTVQLLGGGADAVSRVAQGALTGIGFLGAGVILRRNDQVEVTGLTTAATTWVIAALGITCGAGLEKPALVAAAVAAVILIVGHWLEAAIRPWLERRGSE